jgi:hypothetical protein
MVDRKGCAQKGSDGRAKAVGPASTTCATGSPWAGLATVAGCLNRRISGVEINYLWPTLKIAKQRCQNFRIPINGLAVSCCVETA